jgi:hypothetical protein
MKNVHVKRQTSLYIHTFCPTTTFRPFDKTAPTTEGGISVAMSTSVSATKAKDISEQAAGLRRPTAQIYFFKGGPENTP